MVERLIRGAPTMAPLLFANMGAMGLIVLLDPKAQKKEAYSQNLRDYRPFLR
jgi:hypothetical protein